MPHTTPPSFETGISKKAVETWDATKNGVADNVCAGKDFIRSNPLWTVLGALAVGLILGSLVSQQYKLSRPVRFIDEPLDNLQTLARTFSERAARQAGRGSDAAVSALESILTSIKKSLKF